MTTTKSIFLFAAMLVLPWTVNAQDYLGSWTMSGTTPEGEAYNNTVSFHADGKLTVDFDSDGNVEVHATYTYTDGQISISDVSEESPCHGTTGVYRVSVDGDQMTANLVSDPCEARRADQMVMTRKE